MGFGEAIGVAFQAWQAHEQSATARLIAKYNEGLAAHAAKRQERIKRLEQIRMAKEGEQVIASQIAGYAKSGAVIGQDTPLTVMMQTAGDMEYDRLMAAWNQDVEVHRLKTEQAIYNWQKRQATHLGKVGVAMPIVGAGINFGMMKWQENQKKQQQQKQAGFIRVLNQSPDWLENS